jgi:uncharacterized protein (TIGR00251 family)
MIVKVRVIPDAPENEVVSRIGSVLRVKIRASEVDAEANSTLKRYMSEFFEVRPSCVNIIRGAKGREKTVEITGKPEESLRRVMEAIP